MSFAPWVKRRMEATIAPQAMVGCTTATYVWGTKTEVFVDLLVLGMSLRVHATKTSMQICVNEDTMAIPEHLLFKAFWNIIPVKHKEIPERLVGTELKRLQGVYSKLQVWKVFAEKPNKCDKVLLLDGDMLVRSNMDEVFMTKTPAAVMRGEADTCLLMPRPAETYFHWGDPRTFEERKWKMKGGINGGLILLKPSIEEEARITQGLKEFDPVTDMAEQEFMSLYYGKKGLWNALPKKYNFQLHQMYLVQNTPPPGQSELSSFHHMIQHPEEIRLFHYSSERKPSYLLVNIMEEETGWAEVESHLRDFQKFNEELHIPRNNELRKVEWLLNKVKALDILSTREWLNMWKLTWERLIEFVLSTANLKTLEEKSDEEEVSMTCLCCGERWEAALQWKSTRVFRDHVLFNCPAMRKKVEVPVDHILNLNFKQFFHVPCGEQVMTKMSYLSRVLQYHDAHDFHWNKNESIIALDKETHPEISSPMYKRLAAEEDDGDVSDNDPAHFPADDDENTTHRARVRRYERAMDTIEKTGMKNWKKNKRASDCMASALEKASKSLRVMIKKEFAEAKEVPEVVEIADEDSTAYVKKGLESSKAIPKPTQAKPSRAKAGTTVKAAVSKAGAVPKALPLKKQAESNKVVRPSRTPGSSS